MNDHIVVPRGGSATVTAGGVSVVVTWPLTDDGRPWSRDISGELARNPHCPPPLQRGWWQRELSQIDGLTIHHTLSHSPWATAEHYVHKGGGRPSIPYHIWITEAGEVLLCLPLTEGCWHDHTGHRNTHISVGLAGERHKYPPTAAQLAAAVRVAAWAINNPEMQVTVKSVKGHNDYYSTICPGWDAAGWRAKFYNRLHESLE